MANMTNIKALHVISIFLVMLGVQAAVGEEIRENMGSDPLVASNPIPADDAKYEDIRVNLNWSPGNTAVSHDVYFGDNFDDVDNAAGGLPKGTANYTPGTLKLAETYYWRVDEFDISVDDSLLHQNYY